MNMKKENMKIMCNEDGRSPSLETDDEYWKYLEVLEERQERD